MDADGLLNGRQVSEGEIIGKVATWGDYENGTSYHIHFNIQVFTKIGWVWVNPYMTLVAAYERLIGGRGTEIKPGEPAPPVPRQAAGDPAPHTATGRSRHRGRAAGNARGLANATGQSGRNRRRARQAAQAPPYRTAPAQRQAPARNRRR